MKNEGCSLSWPWTEMNHCNFQFPSLLKMFVARCSVCGGGGEKGGAGGY